MSVDSFRRMPMRNGAERPAAQQERPARTPSQDAPPAARERNELRESRDSFDGEPRVERSGPVRESAEAAAPRAPAAPATVEVLRPLRRAATTDLRSAAAELTGVSTHAANASARLADQAGRVEGRL